MTPLLSVNFMKIYKSPKYRIYYNFCGQTTYKTLSSQESINEVYGKASHIPVFSNIFQQLWNKFKLSLNKFCTKIRTHAHPCTICSINQQTTEC